MFLLICSKTAVRYMPSGMHRTAVYIDGGDLCAERAGYRSAIMSSGRPPASTSMFKK